MRNRWKQTVYGFMTLAAACTPLVEATNRAEDVSKKIIYDSKEKWRDVFTYKPANGPQLPQTRYCYNTLTDVVCYDSAQPTLTSHLNGYQDGENISWVQPGGGSLGVSGGMPTAPINATHAQVAPNASIMTAPSDITVSASPPPQSISPESTVPAAPSASNTATMSVGEKRNPGDPFYYKQSPYSKAKN